MDRVLPLSVLFLILLIWRFHELVTVSMCNTELNVNNECGERRWWDLFKQFTCSHNCFKQRYANQQWLNFYKSHLQPDRLPIYLLKKSKKKIIIIMEDLTGIIIWQKNIIKYIIKKKSLPSFRVWAHLIWSDTMGTYFNQAEWNDGTYWTQTVCAAPQVEIKRKTKSEAWDSPRHSGNRYFDRTAGVLSGLQSVTSHCLIMFRCNVPAVHSYSTK